MDIITKIVILIIVGTVTFVMGVLVAGKLSNGPQHEPIVWTPEELRRLKQSYDEGTREIERAERERIERIERIERAELLDEMRDLNARQSRPTFCTHNDTGGGMVFSYCN